MSSHSSDSEKAPSHRSESPDQELSEDGRAPERNPSNINTNASTGSLTTAKKAQRKPKTAAAATSDDESANDAANVQTPAPATRQNADTRPGGGFVNPNSARASKRKMKWTPENDCKLLIFGLGRDISGKEYKAIAKQFPEEPTEKAIQERLTKLRGQCRTALKDAGIYDPDRERSRSSPPDALRSRRTGHPAPSPSLDAPPKKRQIRKSAAAATPTQPPPPPQGGASDLGGSQPPPPAEGLILPAHLSQPSSLFSPVPAGRGRSSSFPIGPRSAIRIPNVQSWETMGTHQVGAQQMPAASMGLPQMGAGQFQPLPSWALPQDGLPQNGASTSWNVFQDLPLALTPDQLDFTRAPVAPPANPSVPDAEEPAEERVEEYAEGEDEDAEGEEVEDDELVAQQRELDAKRAQRQAIRAESNPR